MAEKYVMVDLNDAKISSLADVLGNKTCKRILEYLADGEANETEIARDLKLAPNTVNYNIKKLVNSGLVEKSKNFFWSVKGKKITQYKLSNKKVVISPKSSGTSKSILGAFLATSIGALLIKLYTGNRNFGGVDVVNSFDKTTNIQILEEKAGEMLVSDAVPAVSGGVDVGGSVASSGVQIPEIALIFLAGGLFALIIFMILNYRRL